MKSILRLGYTQYVMDTEACLQVASLLSTAERYSDKWRSKEDGGTTYHIWDGEGTDTASNNTITLLTDSQYRLYKMAGKPPE